MTVKKVKDAFSHFQGAKLRRLVIGLSTGYFPRLNDQL